MFLDQARTLIPVHLRDKTWTASGEDDVTENTLAQLIYNLANDKDPAYLIAPSRSHRRFDIAAQKLRAAGIIEYESGKWRLVLDD